MNKRIRVNATSRSGHNFVIDMMKSWNPTLEVVDSENPVFIPDTINNFVCVRDYLDTIASLSLMGFRSMEKVIDSWGVIAGAYINSTDKGRAFKYEDFLLNKDQRLEVCQKVEGAYNEDKLHAIPDNGRVSDWPAVDWKDPNVISDTFLSRWKMIQDTDQYRAFVYHLKTPRSINILPIYIECYDPSREKLDFLKKHNII